MFKSIGSILGFLVGVLMTVGLILTPHLMPWGYRHRSVLDRLANSRGCFGGVVASGINSVDGGKTYQWSPDLEGTQSDSGCGPDRLCRQCLILLPGGVLRLAERNADLSWPCWGCRLFTAISVRYWVRLA